MWHFWNHEEPTHQRSNPGISSVLASAKQFTVDHCSAHFSNRFTSLLRFFYPMDFIVDHLPSVSLSSFFFFLLFFSSLSSSPWGQNVSQQLDIPSSWTTIFSATGSKKHHVFLPKNWHVRIRCTDFLVFSPAVWHQKPDKFGPVLLVWWNHRDILQDQHAN